MVRDDLPPQCPACHRPLVELHRDFRGKARDAEDDWDAVTRVVYKCRRCKVVYEDRLDGSELRVLRATK